MIQEGNGDGVLIVRREQAQKEKRTGSVLRATCRRFFKSWTQGKNYRRRVEKGRAFFGTDAAQKKRKKTVIRREEKEYAVVGKTTDGKKTKKKGFLGWWGL